MRARDRMAAPVRASRQSPPEPAPGDLANVLALQRSAGNRAVAELVRTVARTKVKGGVETTVVSPAVQKLLADHKIDFAREVVFDLLDDKGQPVLRGRFDIVFRDPSTKQLVFPELKGDKLEALTKGQKVYVPMFESQAGGKVRIVSSKGGKLYLPKDAVEQVRGQNFLRVGSKNLTEFTGMVGQMATGQPVTNVYYGKEGLRAFKDQAEFEKYLKEKGIPTQKPPATPKLPVQAGDKPLKPPKAPDKPPPNPLYDKPAGKPKPHTGWDPTSGPRQGPRKGPNYKPAPVDKPAKLPPPPAQRPPVPATPPTTGGGGGGGKVAKEVGQATTEAAGKGRVYLKAVAKFGMAVVDGLIPDPLDAIELLIKFAMSYDEARQEIRRRNLRQGFAVGWAAYLVIPRWEWAKWFARTEVSRDVITLVVDAVGVAENAYNEGLVRGFIYGEKHSKRQADGARQRAFDALVKQNRMPGRYEEDDTYTFGRDDVYAFASVLRPAANAVVDEADRRGAERLAAEARARQAEQYRKDYDEGRAPPGGRHDS